MTANIKNLIGKAITEAEKDFRSNPFDYLLSEREAQFLVFSKLRKIFSELSIQSSVQINTSAPSYSGSISPVRLELPIKDKKQKPDIIILTKEPKLIYQNHYEFAEPNSAIEAIIEIKVAWGFVKQILTGTKIKNDLNKIREIPTVSGGYLLLFWGSEYSFFTKKQQHFIQENLKEWRKWSNNNIYIIFRDQTLSA
jgi:hypothetical protein